MKTGSLLIAIYKGRVLLNAKKWKNGQLILNAILGLIGAIITYFGLTHAVPADVQAAIAQVIMYVAQIFINDETLTLERAEAIFAGIGVIAFAILNALGVITTSDKVGLNETQSDLNNDTGSTDSELFNTETENIEEVRTVSQGRTAADALQSK